MLAKRIITGIVGGGLTIFIIYEGNWLFFIMMTLLALLGWREYVRMLHAVKANLIDMPATYGSLPYLVPGGLPGSSCCFCSASS